MTSVHEAAPPPDTFEKVQGWEVSLEDHDLRPHSPGPRATDYSSRAERRSSQSVHSARTPPLRCGHDRPLSWQYRGHDRPGGSIRLHPYHVPGRGPPRCSDPEED